MIFVLAYLTYNHYLTSCLTLSLHFTLLSIQCSFEQTLLRLDISDFGCCYWCYSFCIIIFLCYGSYYSLNIHPIVATGVLLLKPNTTWKSIYMYKYMRIRSNFRFTSSRSKCKKLFCFLLNCKRCLRETFLVVTIVFFKSLKYLAIVGLFTCPCQ